MVKYKEFLRKLADLLDEYNVRIETLDCRNFECACYEPAQIEMYTKRINPNNNTEVTFCFYIEEGVTSKIINKILGD